MFKAPDNLFKSYVSLNVTSEKFQIFFKTHIHFKVLERYLFRGRSPIFCMDV